MRYEQSYAIALMRRHEELLSLFVAGLNIV